MCTFNLKATRSSSAGSTTHIFEPVKAPTFSLTVVPNFAVSLTSSLLLWQHTVTRTAHTLGQEETESRWASWLDACCLFPHKYISIFYLSLKHTVTPAWALCLGKDWDGEGEVAHATREVERRQSEREKGKPEGESKKGGLSRGSTRQFCKPVTH